MWFLWEYVKCGIPEHLFTVLPRYNPLAINFALIMILLRKQEIYFESYIFISSDAY